MNGTDGGVGFSGLEGDGNLNFGCRDEFAVYAHGGQGFEESARDAGVGDHANADDGKFGNFTGGAHGA